MFCWLLLSEISLQRKDFTPPRYESKKKWSVFENRHFNTLVFVFPDVKICDFYFQTKQPIHIDSIFHSMSFQSNQIHCIFNDFIWIFYVRKFKKDVDVIFFLYVYFLSVPLENIIWSMLCWAQQKRRYMWFFLCYQSKYERNICMKEIFK